MSKITTRHITHLNDILSENVIRCAGLIKQVSLPLSISTNGHHAEAHEYSQEYYVIAEIEAINLGPAKQQHCRVEVVIDTDSELECNGIYTSLMKARQDGVYVIFDAVYLALSDERILLQGARAEITNLACDAYFRLISSSSLTR